MAACTMSYFCVFRLFISVCCCFYVVNCRIHTLTLKNDVRQYITMSTFGFYKNGQLEVNLKSFMFEPHEISKVFGFSLERTVTDATSAYLQNRMDRCMLMSPRLQDDNTMAVIIFTMDLKHKTVIVNCSQHLQNVHIYASSSAFQDEMRKLGKQRAARDVTSDVYLLSHSRDVENKMRYRRNVDDEGEHEEPVETEVITVTDVVHGALGVTKAIKGAVETSNETNTMSKEVDGPSQSKITDLTANTCNKVVIPIEETIKDGIYIYNMNFLVSIMRDEEEGLYNLNFHNCPNYDDDEGTAVNLTIAITEKNDENYLSAGEMPLPALYFTMSILFFLSGGFWVFILRKSNQEEVFKIHYVMAVLVYLKSLNLLFHGIHYHFLQTYGIHIESWAILDYITHLLKGALMFTTIVLIGTGWAFIKHVFSDKEKKIFMIIVPLQVLDNVAGIIMSESEEGELTYLTWRDIFILVDLLCCGAILFPVIWSIRHLQEASQTDGKAAINLSKLKLFRHFYIMIVCYIYFSRIIVHLLKITVPFQYEWLDEMFYEMAAFVFFVLTGYKFRPASNNPYFQLPQEEEEVEIDDVITHSGVTEGLKKVNQHKEYEERSSSNRRENSLEYD